MVARLAPMGAVWLRQLLSDMGHDQTEPTFMYCDNGRSIAIVHNPVFHDITKHIEIDCQFIGSSLKTRQCSWSGVTLRLSAGSRWTHLLGLVGIGPHTQMDLRGGVEKG